jgi:hypothetical protein
MKQIFLSFLSYLQQSSIKFSQFLYLVPMARKPTKSVKKLPTKEKPLHIPLAFEDALQIALNTPIKKSKVKK